LLRVWVLRRGGEADLEVRVAEGVGLGEVLVEVSAKVEVLVVGEDQEAGREVL
jgi:hypothetical protein